MIARVLIGMIGLLVPIGLIYVGYMADAPLIAISGLTFAPLLAMAIIGGPVL